MRLHDRSASKISLQDLLRRRKTTLKDFLTETGVFTYERLLERCSSMGVLPPSLELFNHTLDIKSESDFIASSPTEGIVILEPPTLIEENTGKPQEIESPEPSGVEVEIITHAKEATIFEADVEPQDKRKKKLPKNV